MLSPLLFLSLLASGPNPIYAAPVCRGSDTSSAYFSEVITAVVADGDANAVALRSALQLPQLAANNVVLVTDSRTCSKAALAMDAIQGVVDPARQMYVFKLGNTRFAVITVRAPSAPGVYSTAPTLVRYFDSKWTWLSLGEV